jgi:hypothetical protein
MVGTVRSRRIARRRKRALWAAALCSASFLTGQILLGDDPPAAAPAAPSPAAPSLIKQYLEAMSDVVTPPINNDPAAARRSKPVVIAVDQPAEPETSAVEQKVEPVKVEPIKIAPLPAEIAPAASLRPTAVSAANDLPFVPAQPLPTNAEVPQAHAKTATPAVAQTAAAGTSPVENPHVQAVLPASLSKPADDENLPPIVPAWAVPRPGTKKKPAIAPVKSAEPPRAAQPPTGALPVIQTAPPAPRIELGGSPTPSPAMLPQSSPPRPAPTKRADSSPLQSLPQVIEMTPRVNGFQPSITARSPAAKEPSLLPPPQVAMPMPLEIRNPHVSQASQASFETPLAWPSTSRQHVDDVNPLR